jgi:hypothetical protein
VTDRNHTLSQVAGFADIVLMAAGTAAALIWVRFVYEALTGYRKFTRTLDIVLYLLLPALLALVCFGSRRLDTVQKLRVLVCGLAVGLSLYGVELFVIVSGANALQRFSAFDYQTQIQPTMVRLAKARNKEKYAEQIEKQFGVRVDVRSAGEVLADWRAHGMDAVPIVTATNHLLVAQPDGSLRSRISVEGREVMPLGSISNRTTLLCNEGGQWVSYRSDSRGFNNPEAVWNVRPLEIGAIGDSFTHGYCVPGGRAFMDLIRERRGDTLNLGIAGDGPLMMLATLKQYLTPLKPKTVLWFYFEGNDLVDLQAERKSAVLRSYLQPGFTQPALNRQSDIDRAIASEIPRLQQQEKLNQDNAAWNRLSFRLRSFLKLSALRIRLSSLSGSNPQTQAAVADYETANLEVFREILKQARDEVASWHGEMYFVYLPEWARYTSFSSWGKEKRPAVLQTVKELGVPLIDIDPAFRAQPKPTALFLFGSSGHYNEEGHRLVAQEVLRRLAAADRSPQ